MFCFCGWLGLAVVFGVVLVVAVGWLVCFMGRGLCFVVFACLCYVGVVVWGAFCIVCFPTLLFNVGVVVWGAFCIVVCGGCV